MFESLTERLTKTFKRVTGRGSLKEHQVKELLKDVRKALLEADVALNVVKDFVHGLQKKALALLINTHLSSEQNLVKLVHQELIVLMGEEAVPLNLRARAPVIMMLVGLQGAGKTTTAAKLAHHLKTVHQKSVSMVSTDVYRPAAIEQLQTLAQSVGANFICSEAHEDPSHIVQRAIRESETKQQDVLIIDTAGRLHVDQPMMDEIQKLCGLAKPTEVLFVVDSMMGQSAIQAATVFGAALPLTGIILSKMDGDARGGSALSVRQVTGKPIKLIGVGEKITALEVFHPERIASRILGMGDVLSLIEQVERGVDKEKAEALGKKIKQGQGFDLNDFRDQMKQMLQMGGMGSLMDKLPGASQLPAHLKSKVHDKDLMKCVAVLDSMSIQERCFPQKLGVSGSRKRRIAFGSGTNVQQVNKVLKQHEQMQKMMRKMSQQGGMARMMQRLQGRLPPGMLGG